MNDIKINLDLIPDHVAEELAAATLNAVRDFLSKPGGREFLEKKKAEKRKRIEQANKTKNEDDQLIINSKE